MPAKKNFKPILEKVEPLFGSSFSYKYFGEDNPNKSEKFWHYHPELELVYVNKGSGKRQIGSHVSHYRNGDLLLIGANLPHCGFTDQMKEGQHETIIQFLPDFLGQYFFDIPEMAPIRNLFSRAAKGIVFHGQYKRTIGAKIQALRYDDSYHKLLGLLEVLKLLEEAKNYTLLNAEGFMLEAKLEDNNRINTVFNFVKEEFKRPIPLEEVANLINMTVPAFCRYFKKITGKTFVQFVNEYRLTHAAKLLHEKQISITDVCFESGFNNFSYFNKKFKSLTGKSPSTYRNELNFNIS
ncbi:transcriptional regulator, AraC family [Mesonia phycicola]|uniref:Transcriptional regulator, AraC family n=1 Tax=Mesonia phycicola TaxID=579105 RepID=A0A1M6FBJ2_9FLAO|nr:AraC family transcriptional regulator [Mesonia phycicola]SHI95016.1 transcriptional regulator, AraC family [Mesonia phycicola]